MSAWTCRSSDGKAGQKIVPPRPRIPYWKGLGADSEEKHEPVSDIDAVVVDSLKALDPEWPIREADIRFQRIICRDGPQPDSCTATKSSRKKPTASAFPWHSRAEWRSRPQHQKRSIRRKSVISKKELVGHLDLRSRIGTSLGIH